MTTIDLTQGSLTIPQITPVPGPKGDQGPVGPSGMGSSVPGGRLTLVSGSPEMLSSVDHTSTTLYYAPFESDKIPVFDGADWGSHSFASGPLDTVGLSIIGGDKWAANTKRDVFVTLIDGVPTLCSGPSWAGETSSARGIVRRSGLWVNSAPVTCDTSSSSSALVAEHCATWVGSINIGAIAGSLSATFTLGQNRRCDVWNVYHQREILLGVGCPPVAPAAVVTWLPQNQYPAWQAFNNDINNSGFYFTGLPQNIDCRYIQRGFIDSLNHSYCAMFAVICKDLISNAKGTFGGFSSDTLTDAMGVTAEAVFKDRGSVGLHRAIMGTANANGLRGISMWGLVYSGVRAPEDTHVMWIKYQG